MTDVTYIQTYRQPAEESNAEKRRGQLNNGSRSTHALDHGGKTGAGVEGLAPVIPLYNSALFGPVVKLRHLALLAPLLGDTDAQRTRP